MERGIVSMRVGFVLRSAEIQPLVPAICYCESGLDRLCALFPRRAERHDAFRDPFALPPPNQTQHTQPQTKAKASPSIDGTFRKSKSTFFSAGFFLSTSPPHILRRLNPHLMRVSFVRSLLLHLDLQPKLLCAPMSFLCGF